MSERFDLIVFDWDGTLMDSAGAIVRALKASCVDLGLPEPSEERARYVIGLGLGDALRHVAPDLAEADYPQMVDRYRHQAFTALLSAEWRWLAHGRRNDHANLLLSDVDRIGSGLQTGIALMAAMATILAYLSVALVLSPRITLFTLVNGAAVFWLLSRQRRRAGPGQRADRPA